MVLTASVAATAGCLGVFDDGDEQQTAPPVEVLNRTDTVQTVTIELTRPLDWTPTTTATRTDTAILTVGTRELTVQPGERRAVTDLLPAGGRVVVSGSVAADNEPLFSDETSDIRRVDLDADPEPIRLTVWYLEDSPAFERDTGTVEPDTYVDLVVSLGDA